MVPAEALLVGHALQNDLVALKICHRNCVDTAFLFPHPKVRRGQTDPFMQCICSGIATLCTLLE